MRTLPMILCRFIGCCDVKMSVNGGGHVNTAKVLVVKGDHAAMLGRQTAEQLKKVYEHFISNQQTDSKH